MICTQTGLVDCTTFVGQLSPHFWYSYPTHPNWPGSPVPFLTGSGLPLSINVIEYVSGGFVIHSLVGTI